MYKNLTIYPAKRKLEDEWFIQWKILENGKWKLVRKRMGLNRIKTLAEKTKHAKALVEFIRAGLDAGLNPEAITEDYRPAVKDPGKELREKPIIEALEWAWEKHKANITKPSAQSTHGYILKVISGIKDNGLAGLKLAEFRRSHLRQILEHLQKKLSLSNITCNAIIITIQGCYKEFIKLDAFDVSPLTRFEKFKAPRSAPRRILTPEDQRTIYDHFEKVNPAFNVFWQMIYYTSIRISECLKLQIYNYKPNEREFLILPSEKKSKTDVIRHVHIPPQMFKLLQAMVLSQYPQDYYIFGRGYLPGKKQYDRQTPFRYWRDEVMSDEGLGIKVNLYPTKHLGMQRKRKVGISPEAVQFGAGHTQGATTRIYTGEAEREIYKEEIDKNQPDFLKDKD